MPYENCLYVCPNQLLVLCYHVHPNLLASWNEVVERRFWVRKTAFCQRLHERHSVRYAGDSATGSANSCASTLCLAATVADESGSATTQEEHGCSKSALLAITAPRRRA